MKLIEAARKVIEDHQAQLIRPKKTQVQGEPIQYDAKDWNGNKKGWTILDSTTANVMCKVYAKVEAERPEMIAKFDRAPLPNAIAFIWAIANPKKG